MAKRVKKTRNLGKWLTGYEGILNPEYRKRRRKARKAARRARSLNHAKAKGKR